MFLWCISGHEIPYCSRDDSNDGAEPERRTPTILHDNCGNDRWGKAGSDTNSTEDDAVGFSAFADWKPTFDELTRCRIHCRFACAECKANEHENHDRTAQPGRHEGGEYGEESPPEDGERQHHARSKFVNEKSGGDLKGGVSNQKCAEDPT